MCLRVRTDLPSSVGNGLAEWDDAAREWRGSGPCPRLPLVALGGIGRSTSASFPEVRSLDGGGQGGQECRGAVWPGGSCQGKSVCRSHALGVQRVGGGVGNCGQVRKTEKKKKKSKGATLAPGLAQACAAWPVQGRHGSRVAPPACIRNSITSSATYLPAISPNSKIRKPPAPVPALHMCVCLCLRLCSVLLVTVTDRACACLCLKRPPPPPPSLQAELPTSSVSTILLTSATSSFCLSSLALLNPLANLRGPLPVNLFFSSTKYSILARDYQFTPADCPTRQHSRELCPYAHTQSKCLQPRPSDRQLPTPSVSLPSGSLESAPFPVGHPSACQSRRPPRHPFSKSHADLVMLCNSCRRPHPQASPCQPQPVSPQ